MQNIEHCLRQGHINFCAMKKNIPIAGQMGDAKLIAIVDNCTNVLSLLISVGCSLAVTCVASKYLANVLCNEHGLYNDIRLYLTNLKTELKTNRLTGGGRLMYRITKPAIIRNKSRKMTIALNQTGNRSQ